MLGQADGIACRTMEMFEAFGFVERVMKEAYWVNEVTFWKPDEDRRENIVRNGRIQDVEDGLSEFPHVILNQARVHDFYLDVMRNSPSRLEPHYSRRIVDLSVAASGDYPVTVRLERDGGAARGSDRDGPGALCGRLRRSAQPGARGARADAQGRFRQSGLGRDGRARGHRLPRHPSQGDDPLRRSRAACSSFRARAAISSASMSSWTSSNQNERVANRKITLDHLIEAAQRILHPYTLEVKESPGGRSMRSASASATSTTTRPRRDARSPRVHRGRRLPHAQPEGGAGDERLHAGRVQPRMEAGLRAARARPARASAQPIRRSGARSRRT